jgi:hypothetical protein
LTIAVALFQAPGRFRHFGVAAAMRVKRLLCARRATSKRLLGLKTLLKGSQFKSALTFASEAAWVFSRSR